MNEIPEANDKLQWSLNNKIFSNEIVYNSKPDTAPVFEIDRRITPGMSDDYTDVFNAGTSKLAGIRWYIANDNGTGNSGWAQGEGMTFDLNDPSSDTRISTDNIKVLAPLTKDDDNYIFDIGWHTDNLTATELNTHIIIYDKDSASTTLITQSNIYDHKITINKTATATGNIYGWSELEQVQDNCNQKVRFTIPKSEITSTSDITSIGAMISLREDGDTKNWSNWIGVNSNTTVAFTKEEFTNIGFYKNMKYSISLCNKEKFTNLAPLTEGFTNLGSSTQFSGKYARF